MRRAQDPSRNPRDRPGPPPDRPVSTPVLHPRGWWVIPGNRPDLDPVGSEARREGDASTAPGPAPPDRHRRGYGVSEPHRRRLSSESGRGRAGMGLEFGRAPPSTRRTFTIGPQIPATTTQDGRPSITCPSGNEKRIRSGTPRSASRRPDRPLAPTPGAPSGLTRSSPTFTRIAPWPRPAWRPRPGLPRLDPGPAAPGAILDPGSDRARTTIRQPSISRSSNIATASASQTRRP